MTNKKLLDDHLDITSDYKYILPALSEILDVDISDIRIVDHSCGEDVIFAGSDWKGYMDGVTFELIELYNDWLKAGRLTSFDAYRQANTY